MDTKKKAKARLRIKSRVRGRVQGTTERPRLTVFRSNKQIYAQVIDDTTGKTLVAASSRDIGVEAQENKQLTATAVGKSVAEKAIAAGISVVKFDRGGYLYHGRVKSLAEGAREGGLKF